MDSNKVKDFNASILVTSISSKVPLLKLVKKTLKRLNKKLVLFGADSRKNCIGSYFVDAFWEMPRINNLEINKVIEFAEENNIIGIIPTRDGELKFWSKNKEKLKEHGINVMVSDEKEVLTFLDKLEFSKFGMNNGLNIIPTSENIDNLDCQNYVVKERYGAGSKSSAIDVSYNKAKEVANNLNNPIYQPFVEGQEYSVDAYISQTGKIMGVVPRRRDLVINGESQITTTVHDKEIIKATKQLLSDIDLYGHQVVQFIKDKEGTYWLLECNSRYGGASAISNKCGLETFYWFVLESMGENIDDCYFPSKIEEVKQVRYPSDIYL